MNDSMAYADQGKRAIEEDTVQEPVDTVTEVGALTFEENSPRGNIVSIAIPSSSR